MFFYSLLDIGISSKDPRFSVLQVIRDEVATNFKGVKFLCWMDERYVRGREFPLSKKKKR